MVAIETSNQGTRVSQSKGILLMDGRVTLRETLPNSDYIIMTSNEGSSPKSPPLLYFQQQNRGRVFALLVFEPDTS